MKVPDRKYLSEFAVSLCTNGWLIIHPSQLASGGVMDTATAELSSRCHVYVICRRPSATIDPIDLSFDGKHVRGKLIYKIAGVQTKIQFTIPFKLVDGAVNIKVSPYPHRELHVVDHNGETVRYFPATAISLTGRVRDNVLGDLEVLYVGQAYADGKRSAFDRLKSHSTLQKILADMQYNFPDDEILILTFEYDQYRIIVTFDGIDKTAI